MENLISDRLKRLIFEAVDSFFTTAEERERQTKEELGNGLESNVVQIDNHAEETYRHIDFTYKDLMIVLEQQRSYLPKATINLKTDAPIAAKAYIIFILMARFGTTQATPDL